MKMFVVLASIAIVSADALWAHKVQQTSVVGTLDGAAFTVHQ